MSKISSNPFKHKLIGIAILALVILFITMLSNHPAWIEKFYSKGFYRGVCFLLHPILNLFPFSVGDLLYVCVIFYLLYAFVRFFVLIVKRQFKLLFSFVLKLVIGAQAVCVFFYLSWGLNYFRPPAAVILNLQDTSYTTAQLTAVTGMLIDSANSIRARVTATELSQGNSAIFGAAKQAIISLSGSSSNFYTYRPDIKSSLLTPLMNYLGTSGYYNPFTSESQLNYKMPVVLRPFVACHEMSHQMGYGAEDEANFVGFLAGVRSHNQLLKYSAYYLAMEEFMHALRHNDSVNYKTLKKMISSDVRTDLKAERNYWLGYEGQLENISSIFYNSFLKANNQPYGLQTYNQMIRLAMAWYGKNGFYKITPSSVNSKSP